MSFADFISSTTGDGPMPAVGPALAALWHDARADWNEAHALAQAAGGADGAWVHAYLHRKEGDETNAAYWYRRAGQPVARGDLRAEWERIARALLAPAKS